MIFLSKYADFRVLGKQFLVSLLTANVNLLNEADKEVVNGVVNVNSLITLKENALTDKRDTSEDKKRIAELERRLEAIEDEVDFSITVTKMNIEAMKLRREKNYEEHKKTKKTHLILETKK